MLDGFRLEVDGIRVTPLASAQRLLAFLALRGPVARVVAAGTLWGDVREEHAMGSLRTAIWRCNRAVGGLVDVGRGQLTLADFVRIDVAELVEGSALFLDSTWFPDRIGFPDGTGGAAAPLAAFPAVRRAELLPGWYEDWVIFERERLRHLRLHGLEAAAHHLTARGLYAASLEFALEAVRCEPLRESARRAVILVHLAEHNVVEAVRQFEEFQRLLMKELGIEPSAELADLVFRRLR
ncbi:BTAD domain-containing putative transcriptional regulator [Streptomyces sp. NPDC021093]|uniref:AfsR/SARP family transcriptional regulator n=1 Tax=Streptomyces sp. NPDC021093 TaxID=3365112 RepID=UPI0037B08F38